MANGNTKRLNEADPAQVLRSVWDKRGFVLRVAALFAGIGLIAALFGEVEYTASSVVVPQTGREASSGELQGLAAMAGINLGTANASGGLPPKLYPMVVASVPFRKELIYSSITIQGQAEPVVLLDYLTERRYQKFSLFRFLERYTVGLPGLVLRAVRRNEPPSPVAADSAAGPLEVLTPREHEAMKRLSRLLSVKVDEPNGYVTLSAAMPQALAAAQTAARAQELLQTYIVRFKIQKVQDDLDFIQARFLEARADFEAKQRALAAFQDSHRDIVSAQGRARESKLSNEYNLAFSIYSELARQREQAGIQVKEDTPLFTVIEPVTVPAEKSAPRRMFILTVSLLLGLAAGVGGALILPHLARIFDFRWLKSWRE